MRCRDFVTYAVPARCGDGKTRVTKAKDYVVEGGTQITHEETVDIVNEFSKRLHKEGHPDASTAAEILKEVLHDRRQRN